MGTREKNEGSMGLFEAEEATDGSDAIATLREAVLADDLRVGAFFTAGTPTPKDVQSILRVIKAERKKLLSK